MICLNCLVRVVQQLDTVSSVSFAPTVVGVQA